MDQSNERILNDPPKFRPPLRGCIARDLRLAASLRNSYVDTFSRIAANVYRSLLCNGKSARMSELFEELARHSLEQFRLIGELLIALGGENAALGLRIQGRNRPYREDTLPRDAITDAMEESRRSVDRYETLMSRTGDRVVRSVFAKLLGEERRAMLLITRFDDCI